MKTNHMEMAKYPIRLKPQVRTAIWGRETWLVSGYPAQPSIVENGVYSGWTLPEMMEAFGTELTGLGAQEGDRFPLLIKVIEANDRLSLQVHPSEATKDRCGGDPKTEMWYVLGGEDGACLFAGLKQGVSEETLTASLHDGTAENAVERFNVQRGDVLFIPGGLVHAIGGGCRLYEVQQTSDTTWRLHDWNRVDSKTGKPRPLHEREGLAAIDWNLPPPTLRHDGAPSGETPLVECGHFTFSSIAASKPATLGGKGGRCRILFAEDGACMVAVDGGDGVQLSAGECVLIPAGVSVSIMPQPHARILSSIPGCAD